MCGVTLGVRHAGDRVAGQPADYLGADKGYDTAEFVASWKDTLDDRKLPAPPQNLVHCELIGDFEPRAIGSACGDANH
jgi:hypothetical protein